MRSSSRDGKATRREENPVEPLAFQLPCDAFDLKRLIPRCSGVDEDMAERAGNEHNVAVVVDARESNDLHATASPSPVFNIPKPCGCG